MRKLPHGVAEYFAPVEVVVDPETRETLASDEGCQRLRPPVDVNRRQTLREESHKDNA